MLFGRRKPPPPPEASRMAFRSRLVLAKLGFDLRQRYDAAIGSGMQSIIFRASRRRRLIGLFCSRLYGEHDCWFRCGATAGDERKHWHRFGRRQHLRFSGVQPTVWVEKRGGLVRLHGRELTAWSAGPIGEVAAQRECPPTTPYAGARAPGRVSISRLATNSLWLFGPVQRG